MALTWSTDAGRPRPLSHTPPPPLWVSELSPSSRTQARLPYDSCEHSARRPHHPALISLQEERHDRTPRSAESTIIPRTMGRGRSLPCLALLSPLFLRSLTCPPQVPRTTTPLRTPMISPPSRPAPLRLPAVNSRALADINGNRPCSACWTRLPN